MAKRNSSAQTAQGSEVCVPSRAQIAELVEAARLSQHLIEPLHQEVVDMAEVIRLVAAMPAPPAARQRRLKQMGAARRAMKGLADIIAQEPVEPILNKHLSRELGSSLSTQAFERTGLAVADRLSIHTLSSRAAQGRSGPYRALEDEATQLRTLHARKHGSRVLEEVLRRLTGPVEAYLALERENKPRYKECWARPWVDFPASLEQSVDRFLAAGPEPTSLFDEHAPVAALRPRTRKTQKEHFRCAASALVRADVPIDTLVGLRSLCAPERVKLAIGWLVRHRQGRIGGYVEGVMWTLVKTARHSRVLLPQEISEVDRLYQSLALRRSTERRTHKDRDQDLLAQLDTPGTMDALLSLAARTVERVLKSGRRSMVAAREVRRALAIELWLCAPLRLENFVQLRLDKSFHTMLLDGHDRIVVRVPAEQVKYQKQQLEHFLSDDAKELLALYVKEFRPLLVSGRSPWLFPGRRGQPMVAAAFSTDMKRFVHGAVGLDFHPHLVRKLAVKIVLDANPAEIEIARRQLGHAHANTTRKSYTQHQQRAAQQRYLDILEGRRLVALRQGIATGNSHA